MQTEMSDYEIELQNKKIDQLGTIITLLKILIALTSILFITIFMVCGSKG